MKRKVVTFMCAPTVLAVLLFGLGLPGSASAPARKVLRVLIAGGIDNVVDSNGTHHALYSAEVYDVTTQRFVATGSMNEGRVGHTATYLPNGNVLVVGGDGAETDRPVASAEVYDPSTDSFSSVGTMEVARVGHVATLLSSGLVLITGGQDSTFTNLRTAELFDPASGLFTPTGDMSDARTGHTATLLKNGKVLIAGGGNGTSLLSTAELYDPATGGFTLTGSMSLPRLFATATLLPNGEVLIVGGGTVVDNCVGCSTASAEIYDPTSGQFTSVGSMQLSRRGHVAILLKNHNVLVAGGVDDQLPDATRLLKSAELFNTRTLRFSMTSDMISPRSGHAATLLGDGTVLITGGFIDGFTITDSAELFDPKTGSFITTGTMTDARAEHTSTGLCRCSSNAFSKNGRPALLPTE